MLQRAAEGAGEYSDLVEEYRLVFAEMVMAEPLSPPAPSGAGAAGIGALRISTLRSGTLRSGNLGSSAPASGAAAAAGTEVDPGGIDAGTGPRPGTPLHPPVLLPRLLPTDPGRWKP